MVSGAAGSGVFSVVIEALLTARRQEVGRVADPGLEGGQVAVLRLHAASSRRVTFAAYSRKGAPSRARIALREVRRTPLLRTPVNKGNRKDRGVANPARIALPRIPILGRRVNKDVASYTSELGFGWHYRGLGAQG